MHALARLHHIPLHTFKAHYQSVRNPVTSRTALTDFTRHCPHSVENENPRRRPRENLHLSTVNHLGTFNQQNNQSSRQICSALYIFNAYSQSIRSTFTRRTALSNLPRLYPHPVQNQSPSRRQRKKRECGKLTVS